MRTFKRKALVVRLVVNGQEICTTELHPFYVRGRGWISTKDLKVGDQLASHDGQWITVEKIVQTGKETEVINLEVADYHTYFVGSRAHGASIVWAHNDNVCVGDVSRVVQPLLGAGVALTETDLMVIQQGVNSLAPDGMQGVIRLLQSQRIGMTAAQATEAAYTLAGQAVLTPSLVEEATRRGLLRKLGEVVATPPRDFVNLIETARNTSGGRNAMAGYIQAELDRRIATGRLQYATAPIVSSLDGTI